MSKVRNVAHQMVSMAHVVPEGRHLRARYHQGYVQQLPLAVFEYVHAVPNGADNLWARAYQAEQAFLANKPFIDAGFRGARLKVAVYVPGSPRLDPCWRCSHPEVISDPRNYSCERYAIEAEKQGLIPAVQAVAQAAAAIQAEHTILALHGQFPLRNAAIKLDVRTGDVLKYEISRNKACPSVWHDVGTMDRQLVPYDDAMTWRRLLDEAAGVMGGEVRLKPLARLVWDMPCRRCKRFMAVRSTAWLFEAAPRCTSCGGPFRVLSPEEAVSATEEFYDFIDYTRPDALDRTPRDFGLYARDLLIAERLDTGSRMLLQFDGDPAQVVDRFFTDAAGLLD
jgi:hypothetical protein